MSLIHRLQSRRQAFSPEWIVRLIGLGMAMSLLGDATLYIVLPTEFARAGILATDVGLMLSANRAIRIFINTPYGELIERIPRRWMLVPSLFIGGFASLLYTVPGFWPLLIGRLLWGTAWAGIALAGTTTVLDVATDANRGRYVGRLQMWFFIGVGVSSLLGGILFDALGFAPTFYISATMIFVTATIWLLLLPETRHHSVKASTDASETVPAESFPAEPIAPLPTEAPRLRPQSLRPQPLRPTPLFAVIIALILHGLNWLIFIGMAVSLLPVLLRDRLGTEIVLFGVLAVQFISFTGGLSAFNTIISLLSSPLSGWMTDRSGNRWWVVAVIVTMGVVSLSIAAVGDGGWVVLATMLNAIVTSVLVTQLTAVVGDYARPGSGREGRRGRILGIMNTVGDIGGAVGPLLAFALLPIIGLQGIFAVGALVLALLLPGALWAAR